MSSAARGAMLTVGMRWTDRLIGLISTLILARLLVPADFGIIAIATLVISLTEVLFDLGVNVSLIQNREPTREHYDSAWTLRLLQSLIATGLLLFAASWTAVYFKEPRVEPVVQVLALSFLLGGLENIGVVNFQKEMNFGADFRYMFWRRIAGFVTTLVAAWILQSYWALVIGNLVGRGIGVVLSYAMHPMRPRICFRRFREIFGNSQWLLLRNASGYADYKLHLFIVGPRVDAGTMGAYTLADEIAAMPTSELLAPLNRVLFPALVKVKNDLLELKRIFLLSQGIQTLIGIPAGAGLMLVANEVVAIMLGAKWSAATPFLQIFALMNVAIAINSSGVYLLLTLDHARTLAIYSWGQVMLFLVLVLMILPDGDALQVAAARLGVAVLGFMISLAIITRVMRNLTVADVAAATYRPVLGALAMTFCLQTAVSQVTMSGLSLLLLKIVVGAFTYIGVVVGLWIVAGRPYGAETYLYEKASGVLRDRLKRNPRRQDSTD